MIAFFLFLFGSRRRCILIHDRISIRVSATSHIAEREKEIKLVASKIKARLIRRFKDKSCDSNAVCTSNDIVHAKEISVMVHQIDADAPLPSSAGDPIAYSKYPAGRRKETTGICRMQSF